MGRNKKESLVFTSIMCFFMVLVMCFYNMVLAEGFTSGVFGKVAVGFFPALAVAWILDVFVVGYLAKGLAFKIVRPTTPMIRKVLLISLFMVMGMAFCMSIFGSVIHYGVDGEMLYHLPSTYGKNLIFALPLQILAVGPLTRFLFTKIYPPVRTAGTAH